MREETPTKVILGTAAASLAALGIVVATKLTAPKCHQTPTPVAVEVHRLAPEKSPPPPDPVPAQCSGCNLTISF